MWVRQSRILTRALDRLPTTHCNSSSLCAVKRRHQFLSVWAWVKPDTAVKLCVQKSTEIHSVHALHRGINLDTRLVSRLTLFHFSAKHIIPCKHWFCFSNILFCFILLLVAFCPHPPFSPLLFPHYFFWFVPIYEYLFICTPALLCLSLPHLHDYSCLLISLSYHKTLYQSISHSQLEPLNKSNWLLFACLRMSTESSALSAGDRPSAVVKATDNLNSLTLPPC